MNRKIASGQGQSLTEFALILPVLLLILLGALDLGRASYAHVAIANASREGARYGFANIGDISGIQNHAIQEAASSGITLTASDISIACFRYDDNSPVDCASTSKGDRIRVTVTTNFQFLTLYLFRLPNIPLTNSTTMAIVNAP